MGGCETPLRRPTHPGSQPSGPRVRTPWPGEPRIPLRCPGSGSEPRGAEPDPFDEVAWRQTDDFWQCAFADIAHLHIAAAHGRTSVSGMPRTDSAPGPAGPPDLHPPIPPPGPLANKATVCSTPRSLTEATEQPVRYKLRQSRTGPRSRPYRRECARLSPALHVVRLHGRPGSGPGGQPAGPYVYPLLRFG